MHCVFPRKLFAAAAVLAVSCRGDASDDEDSCLMQTRFSVAPSSDTGVVAAAAAAEGATKATGLADGSVTIEAEAVNYGDWAIALLLISLALFVGTWFAGSWLSAERARPREASVLRSACTTTLVLPPEVSPQGSTPRMSPRVVEDMKDYRVGEIDSLRFEDSMTYSLAYLKRWGALSVFEHSVWHNTALWMLMLKLSLIAAIVATATFLCVPDPGHIDASKFSTIASVLTVFLTLMLSFFLSLSVNRWLACVNGFLCLFNAIRCLAMQLHALGVREDQIKLILRYSVLSSKFVTHELRCLQLSPEEVKVANDAFWAKLEVADYGIDPAERKILDPIRDKHGQVWIWVGSLIGRMAMDGDIPPMPSPTYGRIMNLAQGAQLALKDLNHTVIVQMPFIYVHTLSVLVHVTSIVLAVNLGLSLGTTLHGILATTHHVYDVRPGDLPPVTAPTAPLIPVASQVQEVIVELIKGILGPLLFQAFFEIGIAIASPLSDDQSSIPVNRITLSLERDLDESFTVANNLPHWSKPAFKQPPPPPDTDTALRSST